LNKYLAYPIDNFLIPCYHQNSSGILVKHPLFQQRKQLDEPDESRSSPIND